MTVPTDHKIFIIGGGGHAHVVANVAKMLGYEPCFIVKLPQEKGSYKEVSEEEVLESSPSPILRIISGIGSVGNQRTREEILARYGRFARSFTSLVHPKAVVDALSILGAGTFVAQGAQIVGGASLGEHTIINTGAIVDHDCKIGTGCHLSPGAVLSGGVVCGDFVHVGTGASIIQGVTIADRNVIGAGAVVVASIPEPGGVWLGVPARKYA